MRVGVFSQVMLLSYLAFWPGADGREPPVPLARNQRRLLGLMAAQFALIVVGQISNAATSFLPRPLHAELHILGLGQDWRMFSPDAPRVDVRWRAPGQLSDGRTVDLVPAVVPQMGLHGGFVYSRWLRLRNGLIRQPPELVAAVGRYICRRWNGERAPPALLRFELHADVKALPSLLAKGETPPPTELRLRQECQPPQPVAPQR
jgi:hypothetical protein